ncbi:DUF2637 domain-containing protein [Nocardiopsis halotolerans]|uniref:DUF2637 domain-containing protein n=1 Tax=Nocardiopsis halotolerans TaxID=124252 RepID=UPI00034C77E5|nr:DUF2637 domain-containing protein [Nocardiopsis halotolerans]
MAPYNNAPESGTRSGGTAAGRGAGAGALVGGALFVGLIALCALVISYNGIFQFAEYGGHEGSLLAHVFPATYTLLLIMACWVSYLLRGAHPRERFWVDLVLIPALVLFAAVAMLMSNLELIEQVHQGVANVIVAVAPLAALLVAFLLWMTLRAHTRRRRRAQTARPRPADDRTTVLHARAVAPRTGEGQARRPAEGRGDTLGARLLDLGSEGHGDDRADVRDEGPERSGAPFDERGRSDGGGGPDGDGTEAFAPVGRSGEAGGRGAPEGFQEDGEAEEAEEVRESEKLAPGDRHREEDRRWDGPEEEAHGSASAVPRPEPSDGSDDEDGGVSSVPTFRLPRRSQSERNPIRRAVEQTPVVPGAAAPAAFEPDPEPVEPVPDHLADEGFDHEPPSGDPVSDEADAPPEPAPSVEVGTAREPVRATEPGRSDGDAATHRQEPDTTAGPGPGHEHAVAAGQGTETPVEPEWEPAATTEPGPEPVPAGEPGRRTAATAESEPGHEPSAAVGREAVSARGPAPESAAVTGSGSGRVRAAEPESTTVSGGEDSQEPDSPAGATAGDAPEHVPAATASVDTDVPDTAHWEPPEDDSGAHVLADYVPPVWTPPEDDPSPFAEGDRDPEPTPVLDHDAGPDVRAAFWIRDTPPGSARPSEEPVGPVPGVEGTASPHEGGEPEPDALQEPEPLPGPDTSASVPESPPEAEEPPPTGRAETGTPPARRPVPERRRSPLEKRPMVLKPPRPPLPDLTAGPPSRRVRSEPLRPED